MSIVRLKSRIQNTNVYLQNRLTNFTNPPMKTGNLYVEQNETISGNLDISGNLTVHHDLTANNYTEADILAATEYVCAAIEIVGSRVENWNIRITDTVADNASASHFVLGDEKYAPTEVDMVNCKMSLNKNGDIVSEGSGAACMGSPVAAVVWLANTMSNMGTPLQKGDIKATCANINYAKKNINFKPKTSIAEGVYQFVNWYKQYNNI